VRPSAHKLHGAPSLRVARSSWALVMLFHSPFHIGCDAGVERLISALDNVEKPLAQLQNPSMAGVTYMKLKHISSADPSPPVTVKFL